MDTLLNSSFCPPNETVWTIWHDHGLSECSSMFFPAVIMSVGLLLAGSFEWRMYRKYGTPIDRRVLARKRLYWLQVSLTWILMSLFVAQVVIEFTRLNQQPIYLYSIILPPVSIVGWLFSLYLVYLERNFILPSVPTRGHGLFLLFFWTGSLCGETLRLISINSPHWFFQLSTSMDKVKFAIFVSRFIVTALLFGLGFYAPGVPRQEDHLLISNIPYTLHVRSSTVSGCQEFLSKMKLLLPFLWPSKSCKLQFSVILCFLILIAGRVLVPIAPIMLKKIVNDLGEAHHTTAFRWDQILIYTGVIFVSQGSNSLLANIRSFLWIGVQQFTTKQTQVDLYAHLHGLSLSWHLSRKTGEVLKILDRGTSSVQSLLSTFLFSIFPTLADILIAFGYFTYAFNFTFGLIVLASMIAYCVTTTVITEWRLKFRREMNLLDDQAQARGVDALLNFETVKYFNAEGYEIDLYAERVNSFQKAEWKSLMSLSLLNLTQGLCITVGSIAGTLYCAYLVFYHEGLTAGDFVLFVTYMSQMYSPLNFLGTYYRIIQRSFIDMERMFELFECQQDVREHHRAPKLNVQQGQIEFRDVSFSYLPERPLLKHISFVVPPGKTVALVGQTGSGKSTLVRLLFRFYDVNSGAILIDGQNVAAVTQRSLRSHIGVVPQDTVLFNDTIRENIRYGNLGANDSEVEEAAIAADLHDSILRMPNDYGTVVGERGLKLSGGENQRVAIARTILKEPSIVVLDEATSSLDSLTERTIQRSLAQIAEGKTTIIIAHRLSTIVHADQIIVLENGEIIEQGTHKDLLSYNKKYAAMWNQQQDEENECEAGPSGCNVEVHD